MAQTGGDVVKSGAGPNRRDDAEAMLGAMVASMSAGNSCGGPWGVELTPVVKYCGVAVAERTRVLLVNPAWLCELAARGELVVLVDEMRTWHAIACSLADESSPSAA